MKDCWRFKCTMLWVLHNPLSKIQQCCQLSSITDTSHILREFLFFTAHSRNMHSAWDCLLLERKSNRICGKTAMHMLIQNCHFHCKYAFMWSGVYQHLNWELEMLTLLLCVTHFFLQKKIHICMCFCVMFFVWKLACYLEQKSTMVVNKMCSLSRTEEVIEQQLYLEHLSIHEWYAHQYVAAFFCTCTDSSVKVRTCVNAHNFKSSKPPHI